MEPVTLIVAALAAGAGAGALDSLKDDARDKARAAYQRLRGLAAQRVAGRPHGELALEQHAAAPQKWEGVLAAELAEAGASADGDLLAAAKAFLDLAGQAGAKPAKYNVTIRDSSGFQVGDGNIQVNGR